MCLRYVWPNPDSDTGALRVFTRWPPPSRGAPVRLNMIRVPAISTLRTTHGWPPFRGTTGALDQYGDLHAGLKGIVKAERTLADLESWCGDLRLRHLEDVEDSGALGPNGLPHDPAWAVQFVTCRPASGWESPKDCQVRGRALAAHNLWGRRRGPRHRARTSRPTINIDTIVELKDGCPNGRHRELREGVRAAEHDPVPTFRWCSAETTRGATG